MGNVFNLNLENGVGVVTFNVVNDATNTWTQEAYDDFVRVLDLLEKEKGIRGIIFISGKPDNFFAGGNLKRISLIKNQEEAFARSDRMHRAFSKLSALPGPSIAAIHGHCLGGGLEFALACTARIAEEGKTTLIGLPECTVGVLPGAGGTQLLPRLIGYPAIEMILKGAMLPAPKAYDLGIIDRLLPGGSDLLQEAKVFLEEVIAGKVELRRPQQDFSQVDAMAEAARQGVLKANRGRALPGLILALKAIREGVKVSLEEGLEIEKESFAAAVLSNEAKGSINTFFLRSLTDKPKSMMTKGFVPKPIHKLAVLGFGMMGRGIVIDILRNTDIRVLVKDVPEALAPGKAFVQKILEGMAEKNRLRETVDAVMSRLEVVSEYVAGFQEADMVIEAVFEDLKVKSRVYEELCQVVQEGCLIASNTSSIPITTMAKYVTGPGRFGGIHFFSPVWMMQLVEVIRGEQTDQETVDNLLNFAAAIKKRPLVCRDNRGFVVNALLSPYLMNALQFIEEGNGIAEVDKAMTDFGMPVGPIRLIDEVGIDVPYKAQLSRGNVQQTLKKIVEAGRLGLKKSGKGFFLKDGMVDPDVLPLIDKKASHLVGSDEIQKGMLTAMVRVGKDLLDRKIVDDVRMIDVGMIWGTGFPADKGGPMKWADLTGLSVDLYGRNFYD